MTIEEVSSSAMELPEDQRARLAASLLTSLPAMLDDDDEGVSEALRRAREMDDDPAVEMTWDEIKEGIRRPS